MTSPAVRGTHLNIASFAIENDTLFATYLTGGAYSSNGAEYFKYEKIHPLLAMKMGPVLNANEFRAAVATCLTEFGPSRLDAVAIASYGAIDTIRAYFLRTPSDGEFSNPDRLDFRAALRDVIGEAELVIENDATAAAVGEYHWGAGQASKFLPRSAFAYIWISRGVNAGMVLDGYPLGVRFRPETGHMLVSELKGKELHDPIPRGSCSAHDNCISGMAGTKTILRRLKDPRIPLGKAVLLSADYVAQLCAAISLVVAPSQIVLGGRQMTQDWSDEIADLIKANGAPQSFDWGESLFKAVKDRYPLHLQAFPFHPADDYSNEPIVKAQRGILAPLLGVAEIARRRIQPDIQLRR